MIPVNEIKENGREHGVPFSTIERDYIQNWLLKYLSGIDTFVLKGGTGIRKAYFAQYRFSDDLDFTLTDKIDIHDLKNRLEDAVDGCERESEISFQKDLKVIENVNGFKADIYFQISQRGTSQTKIKLDITRSEIESVILPVENRKIIHHYSDHLDVYVKVYSLEEIMAEKIRSIFQRTRPRDLYDLWNLWYKVDRTKVSAILPAKFKLKGIEPDMMDLKERKDDFKNAWKNSLQHQLKVLPDFDMVYDEIIGHLEEIFR